MNTIVAPRFCIYVVGVFLLGACAAPGPSYEDYLESVAPIPENTARFVFLRPRDRDDGSNGAYASIEVDQQTVGKLPWGGFFHVDVPAGPVGLTTFGRFRALGACEIVITATPGATLFIDVGPRLSYMVAAAIGSVAGGIAGAAAVPDVYGSVTEAIATTMAGTAAGSAVGGVAATAVEGQGKRCAGPFKLEPVAEDVALSWLESLNWSKDQ